MAVIAVILTIVLANTSWGRYVYAIGGNEQAALLTGIPVVPVKVSVYVDQQPDGRRRGHPHGRMARRPSPTGSASATSFRSSPPTVIGGTDLMGGYGIPYAAVIGAALIEIVRNALLLAGVDPYWQGTFVGLVIAGAMLLERARRTPAE